MVIITAILIALIGGLFIYIISNDVPLSDPEQGIAQPIEDQTPVDTTAGYEKFTPEELDSFVEDNVDEAQNESENYEYDPEGETVIIYN